MEIAEFNPPGPRGQRAATAAIDTLYAQAHAGVTVAMHQRSFIEALPDAVTIHNEHGDIVDANSAALRLYGHSREVLLTLNVVDLSPTLSPDHTQQIIETCRSSSIFTIETRIRRSDDRDFPVEIHSSVYFEGAEPRVVSVARGIGHWQRTARELHDAEQRHRALMQLMDKGVLIHDARGRIVYVNPAACRIAGIDESQLKHAQSEGFRDWRFNDARGNSLAAEELPSMRALRDGVPIASETVCFWLPQRAAPLWLDYAAVPLFHGNEERPYQVISTFTDVTELKRTKDLLQHTQAAGNIGGYELVADTNDVLWTEEMYRIFDLPFGSRITMERILEMLQPYDRERLQLAIAEARRGATTRNEYEIVTSLGRRRWISTLSRPLWHGNRVYSVVGMCQDVTERKQLERELRAKAITDPVTGMANRESILEELNRQILATADYAGPALLYVDLDRFKVINDILGATAGDRLLTAAARRLQDCLPEGAHCGRFAGDEFLIVLPRSIREERPAEVAETINTKFRRPFEYDGEEFVITASIGIARYPESGNDVQELLHHADAAMAEAKHRGRNTWQAFSPAIAKRIEQSAAIAGQLRHALAHHEFRLLYQPQVELDSGRVVAVEALLRWDHPQRGELQPLAFIQHAENSGEIVGIGNWVIDEACRQLSEWRDAGLPLERIAVNVSYRQLLSESFLETVLGSLRKYGLPGSALELEMVERMLIEDTPDTQLMFKELRDSGVSITIDDFGEGYSALNYLRRLPIDGFKISYDFMRRVPANSADAAICDAIIRVGHGLQLTMVAEGVETEEQRQFLLRHGMRLAQGHLFSPALDAQRVARYIRAGMMAEAI